MIQLERWIKLQQLFNQAAPRQQSYASTQRAGLNPPPQAELQQDASPVNPDPVYTRHSRYAGKIHGGTRAEPQRRSSPPPRLRVLPPLSLSVSPRHLSSALQARERY